MSFKLTFRNYSGLSNFSRDMAKRKRRPMWQKVVIYPFAWIAYNALVWLFEDDEPTAYIPSNEKLVQKYNHEGKPTYQYHNDPKK